MRVAVDDAGVATPTVVAAVNRAGGSVVSAREYRLSFDEIFAELVERNDEQVEAGDRAAQVHDRHEAEARSLVDHELDRRREDGKTADLDDRAEQVERRLEAEGRPPAADEGSRLETEPAEGRRIAERDATAERAIDAEGDASSDRSGDR